MQADIVRLASFPLLSLPKGSLMLKLSNIRIGIKLAAMSGVGILLILALMGVDFMSDAAAKKASDEAARRQNIVQSVSNARYFFSMLAIAGRDLQLAATAPAVQQAVGAIEKRRSALIEQTDALNKIVFVPANRARIEAIRSGANQYVGELKQIEAMKGKIFDLQQAGTPEAEVRIREIVQEVARYSTERAAPLAHTADAAASELADIVVKNSVKAALEQQEQAANSNLLFWSIGFAALFVLVGTAVFGTLTIAKPLIALTQPINELAAGNFNVRVSGVGRKDEVGQIATAVNAMATRVRETIGEIKQSAMEVNSASGEISTSTTDLSQRTEEQAASLEETTAAMEEISSTVRKSSENAEQANKSAGEARSVAARGGEVVAKAVDAMAKIEDSSRKISDIIGVIDEIARQTNLLALNAAVEAARAGEAGRGFAVVASEVRSLAQRSSQAAKDIKDLITNSNNQVQEGVDLVNRAGSALSEIVDSVKTVAELVADIARASTEQATGLDQINRALLQMDEATQQNAALVEENAATAKALETQAQSMDERVAFFKVDDGVVAAPKPVRVAAATSVAELTKPAAVRESAPVKPAAAQPRKIAQAAPARAPRNPVGRMQTALATAIDSDEWKDF